MSVVKGVEEKRIPWAICSNKECYNMEQFQGMKSEMRGIKKNSVKVSSKEN